MLPNRLAKEVAYMRRAVISSISTLALFCGVFASAENPPKAEADADKADFGRYPSNESKTALFKIFNKGGAELKILKISKTCGCSEVSAGSASIVPGGETSVRIRVLPESISGNYAKNVFIETNDPGQRLLQLQVRGEAVPLFEIKPQAAIDLGRISPGEHKIQTFLIQPVHGSIDLDEPKSEGNCKVEAKLQKLPGGAWKLEVAVIPEAEFNGGISARIAIPLKSPLGWKVPEILLTAKSGVEIAALPGKAPVARQPDGSGLAKGLLRVMNGNSPSSSPEEIAALAPAGVSLKLTAKGKDLFDIEAVLDKDAMARLTEAKKLEVSFSHIKSKASCAFSLLY